MAYNLTENQKELARWIVQDLRNGILEEDFRFMWDGAGRVVRGLTGDDPGGKIITKGNVQALCDEGILGLLPKNKSGMRLVVKGRLYEAVDTDFGATKQTQQADVQHEAQMKKPVQVFLCTYGHWLRIELC